MNRFLHRWIKIERSAAKAGFSGKCSEVLQSYAPSNLNPFVINDLPRKLSAHNSEKVQNLYSKTTNHLRTMDNRNG